MSPALVLDCDGVLADTERDGHRVAFNAMFDELEIPLQWSDARYAELVGIGGGKERLASVLTPALREELGLPREEGGLQDVLTSWHSVKTRHYKALISSGAVPGRPGVRRLIAESMAAGWTIAVASTSAREAVDAVLTNVVGDELARQVRVYAGDIVPRKKPSPDIYLLALADLGVGRRDVVVIEDSGIGCRAAVSAGLPTIVTVSAYTQSDDFAGAAVVLSDLGEPTHPATVLADPWGVGIEGFVDPDTLARVLQRGAEHTAS